MARRARTAIAPVTWRDGVHLTGTAIWCDSRRRRDVGFVSSADRVGKTGHGQLIATPLTLALLGTEDGLAVPLRQRFTLGTLRIELIASGRGPGAAALYVEGATKLLYAGPIRPHGGAHLASAEVRACETLVVDAPFGTSKKKFPALDGVIDKTISWVKARLAAGTRPILMVDSALDGLEVATVLAEDGFTLAGHKAIREVVARSNELVDQSNGVRRAKRTNGKAASTIAITAPSRELRPTLWLDGGRDAPAIVTDNPHATLVLSGRATITGDGLPWAHAADRASLLEWIESTRAKSIYVTGASAEAIVKALGDRAKFLGPPQQMSLFP